MPRLLGPSSVYLLGLEERKAEHARRSQRPTRNAELAAARREWGSDRESAPVGIHSVSDRAYMMVRFYIC